MISKVIIKRVKGMIDANFSSEKFQKGNYMQILGKSLSFLKESDCFATASLHKSREEFKRDLFLLKGSIK